MYNAKDVNIADLGKPKVLLVGGPGTGKTSQFLTLPGKSFAYLFDPSAINSLRGFDVDFEMFVPSVVNLGIQSLTKGKGDPISKTSDAHQVYNEWEKDYEAKVKDNFFAEYDNILIDSFTTFADIIMDRVLFINGREGRWPQQDDWTAQMGTMRNVVRTFTGQHNLTLVCTAHDQFKQDDQTKRMINQIMLTGQLRTKLPLLFSDMFHLECATKANKSIYQMQTKPDRLNPSVRTAYKDLDQFIDVTIEDWSKPTQYGLGKILQDHSS
jgi:hypothetical protein